MRDVKQTSIKEKLPFQEVPEGVSRKQRARRAKGVHNMRLSEMRLEGSSQMKDTCLLYTSDAADDCWSV